jgi:hypothetical protein
MLGPEPQISDLPGRLNMAAGCFEAFFQLTDQEREWIAKGAGVRLSIWALPIPPVGLAVLKLEEAEGVMEQGVAVKPDYRCRQGCDALYTSDRAIDELALTCGNCGGELRLPWATEGV